MSPGNQARAAAVAILPAVVLLPLLGAVAAGRDLGRLLAFPPGLSLPTGYPRFSWLAAALVVLPLAALAVAWWSVRRRPHPAASPTPAPQAARRPFPWWGWGALGWMLLWWVLAWTRFPWFAPGQRYTFFPLWLGFILAVNALTWRRSATCAVARSPGRWLGLFAGSAVFWWAFEWLNRFSGNWHYLGVADFGPAAYAANATLCFSTVLPAVAAVRELLGTSQAWQRGCAWGPRLRWLDRRPTALVLLAGAVAGLVGTGFAPTRFYPALWAAPVALFLAAEILSGSAGLAREVAGGDWRRLASWAVAALICGFCWELWNAHSAAKWIYTVPYVERWHVFEMPLLGYTGYLPFGLECYFAVVAVSGRDWMGRFSSVSST